MMSDPLRCEVIISWRAEGDAFIADVPESPGGAADGPTAPVARANVDIVAPEWIATAQGLGRPIPDSNGRLIFA